MRDKVLTHLSKVGWVRPSALAKELDLEFNALQSELGKMADEGLLSRRRRFRKAEIEYALEGRQGVPDLYAGWLPSDGDFPGHFKSMPPGHRLLWSVRLVDECGHPVMHPSMPLAETMDLHMLRAELQDHAANGLPTALPMLGKLSIEPVPAGVMEEARSCVRTLRTVAPEYLDPTQLIPPPPASSLRFGARRSLKRDGWEEWYRGEE